MLYSMGIGIRIPYDSKLAVNVHRACSCHLSPPLSHHLSSLVASVHGYFGWTTSTRGK